MHYILRAKRANGKPIYVPIEKFITKTDNNKLLYWALSIAAIGIAIVTALLR